jgi:hypothetical protein
MNVRKLFRQPGPPRPHQQPQILQDLLSVQSSNIWPQLPPTSSLHSSPFQDFERRIVDVTSPRLTHQYEMLGNTQYNPRLISPDQETHQVKSSAPFPGVDETIRKNPGYPPIPITTISNIQVQGPDDTDPRQKFVRHRAVSLQPAPNARPAEKRKLPRQKVTKEGDVRPAMIADPWSPLRPQSTQVARDERPHFVDSKNAFQRTVRTWKTRALRMRRRQSVDLTLPVSSQQDYLPDQHDSRLRAKAIRRSLDGQYDSIMRRNPGDGDTCTADLDRNDVPAESRQGRRRAYTNILGHQLPQLSTSKAHQQPFLKFMASPRKDVNSLDSREVAPLLPVKLQPAPTWVQTCQYQEPAPPQSRIFPVPERLGHEQYGGLPRPLPSPPSDKLTLEQQSNWHQVRRKAVLKYEDWIVVRAVIGCDEVLVLVLH